MLYPPLEDKANKAAISALADYFKARKTTRNVLFRFCAHDLCSILWAWQSLL